MIDWGILDLDGLTELSDAAVESLSKYEGEELDLDGLTSLSDAAAEILSKHKGNLVLNGLTELTDVAAETRRSRNVYQRRTQRLPASLYEGTTKYSRRLSVCSTGT